MDFYTSRSATGVEYLLDIDFQTDTSLYVC